MEKKDKIADFLGKILVYVLLIGLTLLLSVIFASVINRVLLLGFPGYGC